jgi:hypothetical protein
VNGMSCLGLQRETSKIKLFEIYPYITNWEFWNFLKYGSELFCKNCGETITKYNTYDYCCDTCKHEYMTKTYYINSKEIWKDATDQACKNKTYKSSVISKDYNPIKIISEKENINGIFIYNFLKYGIDDESVCNTCGNYLREPLLKFCSVECVGNDKRGKPGDTRTWDERSGKDAADKRREKLSKRLKGKQRTVECIEKIKQWYKNEDNMEKFKKINSRNMTEERKLKQSKIMKKIILEGKFTPENNGGRRKSHWFTYDSRKFRSRFEIIYYIYATYICNHELEFEKIRIPYKDIDKTRIYITDFFNKTTNTIVEIKPSCFIESEMGNKIEYAKKYAKLNNLKFDIITENELKVFLNKINNSDITLKDRTVIDDIIKAYKSWIEN